MSTEESTQVPASDVDETIEEPIEGVPSSGMLNDLVPPPGTMYYSQRTYNFLNNHEMGVSRKFGRVTWNADVYTYAAGAVAPSDPNFASQGGTIYTVMVHSGHVTIYDNFSADVWNRMYFQIYLSNSNLVPSVQLPYTGSESVSGDNYNYSIQYGQAMQMLKNQGNEAFLFNAKYQQDFSRVKAKQTSSTASLIQFGINTAGGSGDHRSTEIYGLSVFTHKNPGQFPVVPGFKFDINGSEHWAISGGFYLHLGF
ncbi:Transporter [Pleurotus pulmonarius]